METAWKNKFRMYGVVCSICDSHLEIVEQNKTFLTHYRKFKTFLPQIKRCMDLVQIESIISLTKGYDRLELEEMSFFLTGKLISLAKATANNSLLAQSAKNREDLGIVSELELISISSAIAHHTSEYLNSLQEMGITRENVAELQTLISQYAFNVNKARFNGKHSKSSENLLKKLFRDADNVLRKHLQSQAAFFENSEPEFYNQLTATFNSATLVDQLQPIV